MRICFISFCVFLTISCWSQTAQKPGPKPAAPAKPVITKDSPTGGDITSEIAKEFANKLVNYAEEDLQNFGKPSYTRYTYLHNTMVKWLNYQFLEADSEIAISWFKKIDEFIVFFQNTKKDYDLGFQEAGSPEKQQLKQRFEKGLANLKGILEQVPPKTKPDRLEALKRQKQTYLREKKAAERAKSGKQTLFDGDK